MLREKRSVWPEPLIKARGLMCIRITCGVILRENALVAVMGDLLNW